MKKTLLTAGLVSVLIAGCGDDPTPDKIDFSSEKIGFYDAYAGTHLEADKFDSTGKISYLKLTSASTAYWYDPDKLGAIIKENSQTIGSSSFPLPDYMVKRLSEFSREQKELQVELAYLRHEMNDIPEEKREDFVRKITEKYFDKQKNKDTTNTKIIESINKNTNNLSEEVFEEYSAKLLKVKPLLEENVYGLLSESTKQKLYEFNTSNGNILLKASIVWSEEGSNYHILYKKYKEPIPIKNTNSTLDGLLMKMEIVRKEL